MKSIIVVNRVYCTKCKELIISKHVHDFKTCKCENVSVDGGTNYLKRAWPENLDFIDFSEYIKIDDNYNVNRKSYKQFDLDNKCCECGSRNILVHKGNGELINGYDLLGYTCHDCKCLYVFNDIKFKEGVLR